MIDRALEAELRRHFHDRLDGEVAPSTLAGRIAAIPRELAGGWWIGRALRGSRLAPIAAALVLLMVLLAAGWAVGSLLDRLDDDRELLGFSTVDACDLLTVEFLTERYNSRTYFALGDEWGAWWSSYALDWWVPAEGPTALGPATQCGFVNPVRGQVGHLELVIRNWPTRPQVAATIIDGFFRPQTATVVAGYPAWRTQTDDAGHNAIAVLAGPYLVVLSISVEADMDLILEELAVEVIRNLEAG